MNRTTARKLLYGYLESPMARALVHLGVSPNLITVTGLAMAGVSAYLIGIGLPLFGGIVLLLSGVFDILDGAVARATGHTTQFGAFLDSTIDRASEGLVLLGLLIYFLGNSSSLEVMLVYLALAGSFLVSYVRARAEGLGVECTVGVMTRPERVVLLGAALIISHWWLPVVSIVLGITVSLTIVTTIQRIFHVRGHLEKPDSSG